MIVINRTCHKVLDAHFDAIGHPEQKVSRSTIANYLQTTDWGREAISQAKSLHNFPKNGFNSSLTAPKRHKSSATHTRSKGETR